MTKCKIKFEIRNPFLECNKEVRVDLSRVVHSIRNATRYVGLATSNIIWIREGVTSYPAFVALITCSETCTIYNVHPGLRIPNNFRVTTEVIITCVLTIVV